MHPSTVIRHPTVNSRYKKYRIPIPVCLRGISDELVTGKSRRPVKLKIFFSRTSNSISTPLNVFNEVFKKYLSNRDHYLLFINASIRICQICSNHVDLINGKKI